MGQARGGSGGGGGCPPSVGETSPTHTSGALEDREGRWGGPLVDQRCGIGPPSGRGQHTAFPGSSSSVKAKRVVGLLIPPPNLAASARSPMPQQLVARGTPRDFGESISPSKGPRNQHPIGLGADGEPEGTGLPRFSNQGKH